MKNNFDFDDDDDTAIILISCASLNRLNKITAKIVTLYPEAVVFSSLPNARAPHKNGVRRYLNVDVEDEEEPDL